MLVATKWLLALHIVFVSGKTLDVTVPGFDSIEQCRRAEDSFDMVPWKDFVLLVNHSCEISGE